jgi:CubicO group peptidase (beta-lactamase class C family)
MTDSSSSDGHCVHPQDEPDACATAWAAKVVCSAVFLTGRDPREALQHSASWMLLTRDQLRRILAGDASAARLEVEIDVDESRRSVTLRRPGLRPACARIVGDQGAIIVDAPDAPVNFEPVAIEPKGPDPDQTTWPTGDVPTEGNVELDPDVLRRATDLVFEQPAQRASAFVVVHRGRIVAERYGPGTDRETRLEGWSMGKTIGVALVGRSLALHGGSLDDDELFPEWSGDGRRAIRLRDLLQLSSGLAFTGSFGTAEDQTEHARDGLFLDHIYVYAGGIDSGQFCLSKPLEHPPGEVGRYRNCDPLLLQLWLRRRVLARGEEPLDWPQRHLFDPLGMRGVVLETDPFGQFLISGHDYARARDFARLGLLLQQEGRCLGEQILPDGYVDFVRQPAPAWNGERGASVMLNGEGMLNLPEDAYWMSGSTVNRTIIVPSLDLVVVRMGHISGRIAGELDALNRALELIAGAAGA